MREIKNRVNKMITLKSPPADIILHYITFTNYYTVKTHSDHKLSQQCKCGNKKNLTLLYYYIVKETFQSQAIIVMYRVKKIRVNKMTKWQN